MEKNWFNSVISRYSANFVKLRTISGVVDLRKLCSAGLNVCVVCFDACFDEKDVRRALAWGKSTNGKRLIIVMAAKRGFMATL